MANTQIYLNIFIVLNIFLFANAADYAATPRSTNEIQAVLKHSIELKCEYNGPDGNGGFLDWYKNDNESVSSEKPGHYVVKNTDKQSILIIKIFVVADGNVQKWSVKTNKPGRETPPECSFDQIPLKQSPQGITGNGKNEELDSPDRSIRRTEDNSVKLKCIIKPETKSSYGDNIVQWQFSKDSNDDMAFTHLPAGVVANGNEISIQRVSKAHRGFYRCTLNKVSFTILLRVKDRLAALWPFLGIIGVVALLVIVILIFEKRQKSTKKTTTEYDDRPHANDPLVRSSDNETKKRVIKT